MSSELQKESRNGNHCIGKAFYSMCQPAKQKVRFRITSTFTVSDSHAQESISPPLPARAAWTYRMHVYYRCASKLLHYVNINANHLKR